MFRGPRVHLIRPCLRHSPRMRQSHVQQNVVPRFVLIHFDLLLRPIRWIETLNSLLKCVGKDLAVNLFAIYLKHEELNARKCVSPFFFE